MGVNALRNSQLLMRIALILMPAKWQPDLVFLRHVPLRRVHLYTFIQVLCVAALWVIKAVKAISIIFPLKVLTLCFIRRALDYVFTQHELEWLDDLLPENKKKEKEDRISRQSAANAQGVLIDIAGGSFKIPLAGGQFITVNIDKLTYNPETKSVNITDGTGHTAMLKQATSGSTSSEDTGLRRRKPNSVVSFNSINSATSDGPNGSADEKKALIDVEQDDSLVSNAV